LERSGVGNPVVLKKAQVEVVANMPGVGENYQDHHLLTNPYHSNLKEDETLNALITDCLDPVELIKRNASSLG
jgi:choline dehydrogenase-like flavoprotein